MHVDNGTPRPDLAELALIAGARVTPGNAASLLRNGDEAIAALTAAVAGAERFVALSAHVFWGGAAADVAGTLAAKAREGVTCAVLLDGLQTIKTDRRVLTAMRRAGVRVVRAREPWRHPLQLNRRLHRNVVVVDGEVALVGGVGIGDDWRRAGCEPPFRDRDVLLRGPVVEDVLGSFLEEWLEATDEPLALTASVDPGAGAASMLALRSRAGTGTSPLERTLRILIASTQERLDVSTAYFVPPHGTRRALADAARRGVRVRVALAGDRTNRAAARLAGQGLYGPLLDAGVELYEYRPAMLHAKTVVADGRVAAIGSANLDNRSLLLDDELLVFADDAELATALTGEFEVDVSDSDAIDRVAWSRRPLRRRALERAALLVRRDL